MELTRTRRGRAVSTERLADARDEIVRRTASIDGGLRIDWSLLDDDEQVQLVKLTEKPTLDERETARWQTLAEKGAATSGLFAQLRDAAQATRDIAVLTRQVVRRPFSRTEEVNVFGAIGEQIDAGCLLAEHVALLGLLFICWETGGVPPSSRGRVEREGDTPVLVVDAVYGFAADFDPQGDVLGAWKRTLAHLESNTWVLVVRNGNQWRIKPGARAANALAARAT